SALLVILTAEWVCDALVFSAARPLGIFSPTMGGRRYQDPRMALGWMDYCELAAGSLAALSAQHCWRWLKSRFTQPREVAVRFSPRGGCQDAIVRELEKARKEILVQAYSFTADPLTYALVNAWNRGVNVHLLLDKSNESDRYSDLAIFLDQGLHPHIDHA